MQESNYILYHRSGAVTARNLARIFNMRRSRRSLSIPPKVRWGFSMDSYTNDTNFNNPSLIAISGNKLRCANLLDNHKVPVITFHMEEPDEYPVVIRTLLSASGGKGIVLARDESEWLPYSSRWWSKYVNFTHEYRFHVLGGQLAKVFRKYPVNKDEESEFPIRNLHNGYTFKFVNPVNIPFNASDACKEIFKAFPMMMMGVDIGYNPKDGFKVIEINSAPSLNNPTLALYASFMNSELNLVSDVDNNLKQFYAQYTDYTFGGDNEDNRSG